MRTKTRSRPRNKYTRAGGLGIRGGLGRTGGRHTRPPPQLPLGGSNGGGLNSACYPTARLAAEAASTTDHPISKPHRKCREDDLCQFCSVADFFCVTALGQFLIHACIERLRPSGPQLWDLACIIGQCATSALAPTSLPEVDQAAGRRNGNELGANRANGGGACKSGGGSGGGDAHSVRERAGLRTRRAKRPREGRRWTQCVPNVRPSTRFQPGSNLWAAFWRFPVSVMRGFSALFQWFPTLGLNLGSTFWPILISVSLAEKARRSRSAYGMYFTCKNI